MKRTAFVATFLTFLSFILVLSSAVVFLWQVRQDLRAELGDARAERERLGGTLWAAESTGLAQASAVGTMSAALAEADATATAQGTMAAALVTAEAEREGLETALATAAAPPPTGPLVIVAAPEAEASLPAGLPVDIIVSASDPGGIAALNATVDGASVLSLSPADERLVTGRVSWEPPGPGSFLLAATAINARGQASLPVTRTLIVAESGAAVAAGIRARIEANVVAIRGLEPLRPITPTLLSELELRDRVAADLAEYTPAEAHDDALVLSAFDFLSPDVDLAALYQQFYSEQILGFYDTESGEFVVISDDDVLDATEQWTHAHEFVHALQDQYYALESVEDEALDAEAAAALRALAEGDATLTQFLYLEGGYFSAAEVAEIEADIRQAAALPDAAALPPILERSLAFPYEAGFTFVLDLYRTGGYPAIDAAWQNPPVSTEQILHPERYRAQDWPQIVTLPPLTATLGVGWRLLDEDVLGEFFTREYLGQQLERSQVDQAATGWGGDRYAVYAREEDEALAMVWRARWDTGVDAAELAEAYADYAGGLTGAAPSSVDGLACWTAGDVICLVQDGLETVVLRAPEAATIRLLAGALSLSATDA